MTYKPLALVTVLFTTAGCAPPHTINVDGRFVPRQGPYAYDSAHLASVLSNHVERGQVRYASLAQDREPLERYLALISVVGPKSTPELFPSAADRISYYANAYNACALRAVLENYPATTAHDIKLPFEYANRFRVERRQVTLGLLRNMMLGESDGDVRLLFCLSTAALGSPRLSNEPLRPATLSEQAQRAFDEGLLNPYLVSVDAVQRHVYLWDRIVNHHQDFIALHLSRGGRSTTNVMEALTELAGAQARKRLAAAVDYRVMRMPFDRRLNDMPPPTSITALDTSKPTAGGIVRGG